MMKCDSRCLDYAAEFRHYKVFPPRLDICGYSVEHSFFNFIMLQNPIKMQIHWDET